MNNKNDMLNALLAGVLGLILVVCVFVRTFMPHIILLQLNVPNMVLVSLLALLAEYYMAPGAKRCWVCVAALGALTFGLLPWAACFVGAAEAVKLGLVGGAVFTVTGLLFTSMADRLSSGPAAKAAPFMSALGLYLAAQVLSGMIL